ncbi:MAG TPA: carboxypeptidase-like regulatory domain-containing protein, partial [Gemmatimonadaceae bacterium]|nr:carboxypeptidase-like regulatory domain-containing protein [Gemmatimonadaceae bacterium]
MKQLMSRTPSRHALHLHSARTAGAFACLVVSLLLSPRLVRAQTGADVVRGRVTDDSARAIAGASVTVTRGPDRLVQKSTTDSTGAFSLRFDPGTGDYLVYVAAPGFASARRRVQREGSERELVANFVLRP